MPVFPQTPAVPGVPGGLVVADYQYEFRGLLFGSKTSYIVEEAEGILSAPKARDNDENRAHAHGMTPGTLLFGKRIIQFDMKVTGAAAADIEVKLAEARRAFQPPRIRKSRVLEPLVFLRPNSVKKIMYVRCTKRDFSSTYNVARGLAEGSVELQAPDPLIYALTGSQQVITLNTAATTVTGTVSMAGDHVDGAAPTIVIEGLAQNPIITNNSDDARGMRFTVTLAATDAMRVNGGTKVVEVRRGLAGAYVRDYSIVRSDNQWWNLLPGSNSVQLSRSGSTGSAATMTVTWKDTYQ